MIRATKESSRTARPKLRGALDEFVERTVPTAS